ncbi:MAG: hypothetical protein WCT19_01385 [Candidatus Paceibacterota bacterium]
MKNRGVSFVKMSQINPPENLAEKIVLCINLKKKQVAKTRLAFGGIFALFSFGAIIPVSQYVFSGFMNSGFFQYFSLFFSDIGSMMPMWKNFALSMAESLPAFELMAFLLVVLILMASIRLISNNFKMVYKLGY